MKDRSAHGGRSPEAPKDEFPIAQEEDAGEAEDKESLSRPRRRPGGAEQSGLVWVGVFHFLLSGGYGKRRSGSPGLTLSELETGIGLKAEKWSCHLVRQRRSSFHGPSGRM